MSSGANRNFNTVQSLEHKLIVLPCRVFITGSDGSVTATSGSGFTTVKTGVGQYTISGSNLDNYPTHIATSLTLESTTAIVGLNDVQIISSALAPATGSSYILFGFVSGSSFVAPTQNVVVNVALFARNSTVKPFGS